MKPKIITKQMEDWREKVFDILAKADGSGMDKTIFINEIMSLLSLQKQDLKKKIGEWVEENKKEVPSDSEVEKVVKRNKGNVSWAEVWVTNANDVVVYNQALSDLQEFLKTL